MFKVTRKAIKKVNEICSELENHYKGSEITMELLLYNIIKQADNKNDQKNMIKYLWEIYEWNDYREQTYYRECIKNYFHVVV